MKTSYNQLIKLANHFDKQLKIAQSQQPVDLTQMLGMFGQMAAGVMGQPRPQQPYPQQPYPQPSYPNPMENDHDKLLRLIQELGAISATLPQVDPQKYISYIRRLTTLVSSASTVDFSNMANLGSGLTLLNQVITLKQDINRDFGDNQAAKKIVDILDKIIGTLSIIAKNDPQLLGSSPLARAILDSVSPDKAEAYANRVTRILRMVADLDNAFSNPGLALQIKAEIDSLKKDLQRDVGSERIQYVLRMIDWTFANVKIPNRTGT